MTDDEKVAQRYRELGPEEPPRTLDEAILAASRRSVRPWTQRWAVPLSLAAVVVLSVTVTLRIQQERPGVEIPAPPQVKESVPTSPASAADAQPKAKLERPQKLPARKEPEPFAPAIQDKVTEDRPSVAAAAPAPVTAEMPASRRDAGRAAESSAAGAVARQAEAGTGVAAQAQERRALAQPQAVAAKTAPADTPERELERIAELRRQDRHEEADRVLAEFRKRHPAFRIPEAMRERVERR